MTDRLFFSILCCTGCGELVVEDVDASLFDATPTYRENIEPLLFDYCVNCHSSQGIRNGGVELDTYQSAYSGQVRNACVSVRKELADRFTNSLMPYPRDPPVAQSPCGNWEPFSMPKGALPPLTSSEQVLLLRWVETGAPP